MGGRWDSGLAAAEAAAGFGGENSLADPCRGIFIFVFSVRRYFEGCFRAKKRNFIFVSRDRHLSSVRREFIFAVVSIHLNCIWEPVRKTHPNLSISSFRNIRLARSHGTFSALNFRQIGRLGNNLSPCSTYILYQSELALKNFDVALLSSKSSNTHIMYWSCSIQGWGRMGRSVLGICRIYGWMSWIRPKLQFRS